MKPKIFGIGFHKTGTTSLATALRILGYDTIHGDPRNKSPYGDEGRTLIKMIDAGNYQLPTIKKYEAFTDNPYFSIWKELDQNYLGSKFILTIRDDQQWLQSCLKFYAGRRIRPMRTWMFKEYADPSLSETARRTWIEKYQQHNQDIKNYFRSRPSDLLILDVSQGNTWNLLCSFLNKPIPAEIPFPKKNSSIYFSYSENIRC